MLRPAGGMAAETTRAAREAFDVLNWAELFVPEIRHRRCLMIWVSNKARRRNGVAEACQELSIPRATFDRWRIASVAAIVHGLNTAEASRAA